MIVDCLEGEKAKEEEENEKADRRRTEPWPLWWRRSFAVCGYEQCVAFGKCDVRKRSRRFECKKKRYRADLLVDARMEG